MDQDTDNPKTSQHLKSTYKKDIKLLFECFEILLKVYFRLFFATLIDSLAALRERLSLHILTNSYIEGLIM